MKMEEAMELKKALEKLSEYLDTLMKIDLHTQIKEFLESEEKHSDLVIAFDISGSMGDAQDKKLFLIEVIKKLIYQRMIDIILFNGSVRSWFRIESQNIVTLQFQESGIGTNFGNLLYFIDKLYLAPIDVIIFTDGHGFFGGHKHQHRILWLVTNEHGDRRSYLTQGVGGKYIEI